MSFESFVSLAHQSNEFSSHNASFHWFHVLDDPMYLIDNHILCSIKHIKKFNIYLMNKYKLKM